MADVNNIVRSLRAHHEDLNITKPLQFDEGLLTITDPEAPVLPRAQERDAFFQEKAREAVQGFINKIYSDFEVTDGIFTLPEAKTILPRAKPVPQPKQPTKWERFAQEKGIKSNKGRDKSVWDDETQKWVPRYGFKRAQNEREKNWVTELPDEHGPQSLMSKRRFKPSRPRGRA